MKPGSNLLLTAHLKTTGKKTGIAIPDRPLLRDKGDSRAQARAAVLRLRHRGPIEIPAGASSTELEDSYKLPEPASITAIYPRAHFLARSFRRICDDSQRQAGVAALDSQVGCGLGGGISVSPSGDAAAWFRYSLEGQLRQLRRATRTIQATRQLRCMAASGQRTRQTRCCWRWSLLRARMLRCGARRSRLQGSRPS